MAQQYSDPQQEFQLPGSLHQEEIGLVDTTLCDGEQTSAVVFARQEKLIIARQLDTLGVREIEAGMPGLSEHERGTIKAIVESGLSATVIGFCRADNVEDVRAAADAGVKAVTISLSTSDIHLQNRFGRSRQWALETMLASVGEARALGLRVTVSSEDATRTDPGFLVEYASAAKEAGASRFRFCDTMSRYGPLKTYQVIGDFVRSVEIPVAVHTHNDFGMATANALAGLHAGARFVVVTVGGLGERAGHAALEEVVMALKYLENVELGITTERFREVAEYVAQASARAVPIWKAIVGTNVFAHESGIHADGVIKDPLTYEAFSPDEVGLTRQLVVGKHSGSHTILHKFKNEFGVELTEEQASEILSRARTMAVQVKRALFDKELMYIYHEYLRSQPVVAQN